MRSIQKVLNSLTRRSAYNKVEVKVENKIGFIYLNSPADFNALSEEMRNGIANAVRSHEASKDVKVILFLSLVKKAFCAGANIKEFTGKTSKDFENNDIFKDLHDSIYNAKKPILSGINGVALGGGCELALLTDVAFCSEDAKFALPELKLGLIPGIGGTQR
jgi:enoyl-CoA hydratase/carnithine racemase